MTRRILTTVFVFCVGCHSAPAQTLVRLSTNVPDAVVYADSVHMGPASRSVFQIPQGTQTLRLVPGNLDGWTNTPRSVAVREGADTLFLTVDFPYHYRIESFPFGADVYLESDTGSVMIGDTPLVYQTERPVAGGFRVEKEGYRSQVIVPGHDVWNRHTIALAASGEGDMPHSASLRPRTRKTWIDYASLGLALGAGALTVHHKFKADRLFDRYRENGDPRLVDRIHTLDTRAGISLGVMQVGVGVFAYRLIFR